MPRETERHVEVLNKLKNVIQHTDSKVVAERRLAIERWVENYVKQDDLKSSELQFLCNIFSDESYWSGIKLNAVAIGHSLTKRKISGIDADCRTIVLKELQNVIECTDSEVAAGRSLSIERWVKTYIRQVEYLKDDELQFLRNVFYGESCWSGTRLNNTTLGQKLTEEKIGGIDNPLCRYDMACRYCVTDKIHPLFQEQLMFYKGSFSSEEVDDDGKPATRNDKYVRSELLGYMKSQDPVFGFWTDENSGNLKNHNNAADSFQKAVEFKWNEGVEYFYHRLNEQERKREITSAITTLSSVQCDHNGAVILDFCLSKMSDQAKNKLFKDSKLLKKDKGVYSLLNALIDQGFFDTVQVIVPMFKDKVLADKILSAQDYTLLLSSLSDIILENPELGTQAKAVMMDLWRCEHFNEHKKAAVDSSKDIMATVSMKNALARLIVDWRRDGRDGDNDRNTAKKNEVLEILQFAKDCCSSESFAEFRKSITSSLRMSGRTGMKKGIDYGKLAGKLFDEVSTLHKGNSGLGGSGDPQSLLDTPGISGLSVHSK